MRILQLRKWLSARQDNGGKVRATGLGRALSHFAEVDAVGFRVPGDPEPLETAPPLAAYRQLHPVRMERGAARAVHFTAEVCRGSSFRSARFRSVAYQRRVAALLSTGRYSAVQVEELSILRNLPGLPLGVPVVYSAHNVESELSERLLRIRGGIAASLAPVERRRAEAEERRALAAARLCFAVSDDDRRALEALAAPHACPIHVVPNGVDDGVAPAPAGGSTTAVPHEAVFVACFAWRPNAEGAYWFLSEVLPCMRRVGDRVTVRFVGSGLDGALAAAIESAGCAAAADVPDPLPYLHAARAAIVPLLSGGGTRLKILEAWAAGVPVVSTQVGAAGLDCVNGEDAMIACEPESFAGALRRVLDDDALHAHLRRNGLRRASFLRWSSLGPRLAALYATLNSGDKR
ncbi:MAG: glycosyl transferase group 1 [Deltaproteobacteria bacterium]|nr:glycosyl transferase group 1 [Deltaproteobacteria bacterium]